MVRFLPFRLAVFIVPVLGDTHSFFSGFFSGSTIVAVQFDDTSNSLTIVNNITTPVVSGSKWINIDGLKKNLYVATTGYFQSYSISEDLNLTYKSNISLPANCTNANFIASSSAPPYTVFGTPYGNGCSSLAISVSTDGSLSTAFANVTYDSRAGVHGTGIASGNDFIYSADDIGNGVWAHSYNSSKGTVTAIQHLSAASGSDPRHLAVHPNGNWVYVVYEAGNSVAAYSRDATSGLLTFTNNTFSLLPTGYTNSSLYWADEVMFSVSGNISPKYLLAATRSRNSSIPGFVSAFELDSVTGAISKQLFLLPTTGSGGSANAVSPAGFSEDYFAITDSSANTIEVWKIDGETANTIAGLSLVSGPTNVVWVD